MLSEKARVGNGLRVVTSIEEAGLDFNLGRHLRDTGEAGVSAIIIMGVTYMCHYRVRKVLDQ